MDTMGFTNHSDLEYLLHLSSFHRGLFEFYQSLHSSGALEPYSQRVPAFLGCSNIPAILQKLTQNGTDLELETGCGLEHTREYFLIGLEAGRDDARLVP